MEIYCITTKLSHKAAGVIMKLNKRCPWCGEELNGRFSKEAIIIAITVVIIAKYINTVGSMG